MSPYLRFAPARVFTSLGGIAPALRGGAMSIGGIAPALRGGAMSIGGIAPALRGGAMSIALALGLLAVASAPARADTQIGFDLDYALPIESIGDGGGGFGIRLGQQLHLPLIALTPEVVFAYHSFAGRGDPATYKGVAGLRVGFGEIIRLGPFAHLGIGHQDLDLAGDPNYTGFCWDAGLFFDLTIIPFINVGVHGAYNQLSASDEPTFHWATFGAHAELIF